ncbi:transposase [Candidatus Falkowbacteria bacterium]|nr:transposase [Candidatus Falkowbacteria bacterium]
MTVKMPNNIIEERLRWVLPIVHKEIKLKDYAKVCPYGKRTLERWVAAYKKDEIHGLHPKTTRPKSQPNETPIAIKEQVIALRNQKKVCALKLKWKLQKQGICLHERTIGKILKNDNLVRKYRVKKIKYKYIKAILRPGELVEIDVKYVPGTIVNKRYFQYTAIDCATRWRHLEVYDAQCNSNSIAFLKEVMSRFPYTIKSIKTDNGAIFTSYYSGRTKRSDMTLKRPHPLDEFCSKNNIIHYLIDPGKPAQNGKVERSHREDQEKFYDMHTFKSLDDLREKIKEWNIYYNDLEHIGLKGLTPNEALKI